MTIERTARIALPYIALLFLLNVLALRLSIFYIVPWFDTAMHVLGGFVLGVLAAGYLAARGQVSRGRLVLYAILLGLLGGMPWELLKVGLDVFVRSDLQPDWADTLTDLVADTIGATAGAILIRRRM